MARHKVLNPQFKVFMTDSAQVNWNAIRTIYNIKDPKVPMKGRERTYFSIGLSP